MHISEGNQVSVAFGETNKCFKKKGQKYANWVSVKDTNRKSVTALILFPNYVSHD